MNKKEKQEELVLCIYDENGVSVQDKIIEIFSKYVLSNLQKVNS